MAVTVAEGHNGTENNLPVRNLRPRWCSRGDNIEFSAKVVRTAMAHPDDRRSHGFRDGLHDLVADGC